MTFPTRAVFTALTLVLIAGACSDDDAAEPSGGPAATTQIDVDVAPGSDTDAVGALDDVSDDTCTRNGASWESAGTVTNPTDDAASYRIYVSFLDGTDTVALLQGDVENVAAGQSGQWSVGLSNDSTDLNCVLRVERIAS